MAVLGVVQCTYLAIAGCVTTGSWGGENSGCCSALGEITCSQFEHLHLQNPNGGNHGCHVEETTWPKTVQEIK